MKRIVITILTCILFFVTLTAAVGAEINIITPQDKTLVSSNQVIMVIDLMGSEIDQILIDVNEETELSRKVFSGERYICWGDIPLVSGINLIQVTALKSDRVVVEKELNVYGRALGPHMLKKSFKRVDFHNRKSETLCVACHNLGTNPPDQSACFACHGVKNSGSFVHEPTVTSCLTCHNHKTPLGTQTERELCGKCHMLSMDEWGGKKYEHGPFALGLCTACHDPHASGQPRMLKQEPTELCLTCHDDVESRPHILTTYAGQGHPIKRPVNPSRPDEPFTCYSCHNPHAGDSPLFIDMYVDKTRLQFCVSCHNLR